MWKEDNNTITKDFQFKNFKDAFAFLVKVAMLAEQYNHHPKIVNEYNKVSLSLCTHDAGAIVTEKDIELAEAIDKL